MQLIKENLIFLKALAQLSKKQSQQVLKHCTREQANSIAEIAHNMMAKVLRVSEKDLLLLKKYKVLIRKLAEQRRTQSHKHLQKYLANKVQGIALMLRIVLPKLEKAL